MEELMILAFDHRGSFMEKLFNIKGREPTAKEAKEISRYKRIVYDGYVKATQLLGKRGTGILMDEQFASAVAESAARDGFVFAMPVEKSGQDEFDFEYADWKSHIEKFSPTFVKVLVRFNPEGDSSANARQMKRLRELNDYLKGSGRRFLFELLVPATESQLTSAGNKEKFDVEIRPKLMVSSMRMLQEHGIEPDIWKLEGVDKESDARALVAQAQSSGRRAGVVTLGRGESAEKVAEWLKVGAKISGIIGFAVGRTIFMDALKACRSGTMTENETVSLIAKNYGDFVRLWRAEKNG